jgi:Flp pilus assembly protein TadD
VNPCLFEAWNNRGNALVQSRREKEARESYLKAVAVNPAYPDALFNIALSYNRSGDRAMAREWLRKTRAADPAYRPARETAAAWGVK